jgi:hypothetical protein
MELIMRECLTKEECYKLPWWQKDKQGWPIEHSKNKPIKFIFRMVVQNLKKISVR